MAEDDLSAQPRRRQQAARRIIRRRLGELERRCRAQRPNGASITGSTVAGVDALISWGVAAGQGLVFSLSRNHKLVALDAATGSPLWQRILEGRPTVAPFLWAGRAYVSDDEGWAYR